MEVIFRFTATLNIVHAIEASNFKCFDEMH